LFNVILNLYNTTVDQAKKKKVAEAKDKGLSPPPPKKRNVQPPSKSKHTNNPIHEVIKDSHPIHEVIKDLHPIHEVTKDSQDSGKTFGIQYFKLIYTYVYY
jgi:hypothetical protein